MGIAYGPEIAGRTNAVWAGASIMEVQFKAGMKRREMAVAPLTEMTDHHRLEEWQG
jgi:hypothetical protein